MRFIVQNPHAELISDLKVAALRLINAAEKSLILGYHNSKHALSVRSDFAVLFDAINWKELMSQLPDGRIRESINLLRTIGELVCLYHDVYYRVEKAEKTNEWHSGRVFLETFDSLIAGSSGRYSLTPMEEGMIRTWVPLLIEITDIPNHLSDLPIFDQQRIDEIKYLNEPCWGTPSPLDIFVTLWSCIMDADLSSLAVDWVDFLLNQEAIICEQLSREKITVQEKQQYLIKSAEFLKRFLDKPSIYRTVRARRIYEITARNNIERLIRETNSRLI